MHVECENVVYSQRIGTDGLLYMNVYKRRAYTDYMLIDLLVLTQTGAC